MKHVIDIQDYGGNRVARLLPTFRVRFDENHVHVCNYNFLYLINHDSFKTQLEQPYCIIHCPKNFIVNPDLDLPFVKIPFSIFADNVRQLLTQHNGTMPLAR
jgi:hypothetical protein